MSEYIYNRSTKIGTHTLYNIMDSYEIGIDMIPGRHVEFKNGRPEYL